jgi:DNA primase
MVMLNQPLIALVNSVLGVGKPTAKGNYAYVCPFHTSNPPGKKNLEVNMSENEKGEHKWHCWGCNAKGKKIHQIFKKLNVHPDKVLELSKIEKYFDPHNIQQSTNEKVELPKEFKLLTNIQKSDIIGRHALSYAKSRNISEEDILKYNIGYCESGPYKNTIIIPSYNENGELNYFTGRSFEKETQRKYKNPTVSRNIIPFEIFINWDLPIILCEGPFDAIAIKRNVIPLLGKNIQSNLMKKIVMSSVEKIYIALDKDAQKQALSFCEQLMNEGKEIYLVNMKDKDPSEMGFEHFTKLIQETTPLTFSELLGKKLSI